MLGNIVHLLHQHPAQWEELKRHLELIPSAVEECLRIEAPKQRNFRRSGRTHEFHGVTIPENDMVFQLIGSANHDERQFENPEVFDIRRTGNAHLTFGAGIHFCVGAVLARLEARVFLEQFLGFPGQIRMLEDGSFAWQTRVQMRGPGRLFLEAAHA